ncbi:MAG: hypothetical protein ACI81R_001851 [Bradymonadia bacterium]|jgi:hypothetical protein
MTRCTVHTLARCGAALAALLALVGPAHSQALDDVDTATPSTVEAAVAGADTTGALTDAELAELELLFGVSLAESEAGTSVTQPAATSSSNPNISLILDVAGAYYSERDALQLGGHDPRETGFTLQQLELHFDASVDPYFRLDANLVFSLFGVEVEEVFATSTRLPAGFQLRVGQFLTRFGRLNPTHPHTWSFVDQALIVGKFFGSEGSRGLGFELSWLAPTPWFVEAVVSVTNADGECCARSFYSADADGIDGVEDLLVTAALKQFFDLSEAMGLLVGVSGQFGPNPSGYRNRTNLLGADLTLRVRPPSSARRSAFTLSTEAIARVRQLPGDSLRDWGLVASAVYNITPRWEVGARYEYVAGVAGDLADPEWVSARDRTSAQVTYRPSHFSRFRLQGKYDDPEWTPRPIFGVVLAAEFLIGAHGSHAY